MALASAAGISQAAQALEILALRHATVEEVLPVLRPLLEPGGVLTGRSGQVIVRASEANIGELRRALEAIDRPRRRLQILVRLEDEARSASDAVEARGAIGTRGSRFEVEAESTRARATERVDQRLQVLEGARALIAMGESRPLAQRQRIRTPAGVLSQETFVVQEAQTGIEVTPRVAGDTVILEVSQRQERFSGGGVAGASVLTSVQGRLGEWIALGSLARDEQRNERGLAAHERGMSGAARRIWVKVEELPR